MTTKTNIALAELAEKGADADLLRDMIHYVAQRLMELDTEGLCAAAYGERSPERANSRNGYRERLWETRAGSVDLKIPKLRKVRCLSRSFGLYRSPAVRFNGTSDGIAAVRRAERQVEQTVEWVGDDRVGVGRENSHCTKARARPAGSVSGRK